MALALVLDKITAIFRRDLLTSIRYRSGFVMTAFGILAELATFYYLSYAIGPRFRPRGMEYFSFLLVGTGFYTFLIMGINSFLTGVQEAQQAGTLEVLMSSSTSASTLIFLSAASAFARNVVRLICYFGLGFLALSSTHIAMRNLAWAIPVFFLSVAIALSIGVLASALQIGMQKGSAVVWLLGSVAWFMTGTLFPVSVLPKPLAVLAQSIPITHCLDALRLALFEGNHNGELLRQIFVLGAFSITLLPASLLIFSFMLRRARVQGTLSFY